jgi:hypothetical protein
MEDDERTVNLDLLEVPIDPSPSNARKRVEDWWNSFITHEVEEE